MPTRTRQLVGVGVSVCDFDCLVWTIVGCLGWSRRVRSYSRVDAAARHARHQRPWSVQLAASNTESTAVDVRGLVRDRGMSVVRLVTQRTPGVHRSQLADELLDEVDAVRSLGTLRAVGDPDDRPRCACLCRTGRAGLVTAVCLRFGCSPGRTITVLESQMPRDRGGP
jgi:hypothetical protein